MNSLRYGTSDGTTLHPATQSGIYWAIFNSLSEDDRDEVTRALQGAEDGASPANAQHPA